MICILHGYLLEGSGSNLWTRSIARSLCAQGYHIHLMCQENHPEIYDFITKVITYNKDGEEEIVLDRDSPFSGSCTMHKPYLGEILPVYVLDKYEEFKDVRRMINMETDAIEKYIDYNVKTLKHIIAKYEIKAMHANHTVLMSVVAQRASEGNVPYAVMPHGSAIEYAVKPDQRFHAFAQAALQEAHKIFVIGKEIKERLHKVFPALNESLDQKMIELNLGVNTDLFKTVPTEKREEEVDALLEIFDPGTGGRTQGQYNNFAQLFEKDPELKKIEVALDPLRDFDGKKTDVNFKDKIKWIDWQKDPVMLFVGRHISSKGLHSVILALLGLLPKFPNLKMLSIGHGPFREVMEAFLLAVRTKNFVLAKEILAKGNVLEGFDKGELTEASQFLKYLEENDQLDSFFEKASEHLTEKTVVFTGYLTHTELRYLFPCCTFSVFPSVVAEAGPLVFLEALASGSIPLGTYFAGMKASIDRMEEAVGKEAADIMKLRPEPEHTVVDIISQAELAMQAGQDLKNALRAETVAKYEWKNISGQLIDSLTE
jgi:glycosyltransferase involved in cell wall biosynthesis